MATYFYDHYLADLRRRSPTNRCPDCGDVFVELEQMGEMVSNTLVGASEWAPTGYVIRCRGGHEFDVTTIQRYVDGGYEFAGLTRL